MNSLDIKKRLNDLKKVSVQLKDSTDSHDKVDFDLINTILQNSKSISHNSSKASLHNDQSAELPVFKMLIPQRPDTPSGPTFGDSDLRRKEPPPLRTQFYDQEVITLREENTELEKTLMVMRDEIKRLEQVEKRQQEDTWKDGIPYFELSQEIEGFLTKLSVGEEDYDKIDFIGYKAMLGLDKLLIQRKGKNGMNELDVSDIKEVHYIEGHIMLLEFESEKMEDTNLFLKFPTGKDLHRWDLALYINYEIIRSLTQENLFASNKSVSTRKLSDDKKPEDVRNLPEKELLKILVERQNLYLETKKILEAKISEKVHKSAQKRERSESPVSINSQEVPLKKAQNIFKEAKEVPEQHAPHDSDELFENFKPEEKQERADTSKFLMQGMLKVQNDQKKLEQERQAQQRVKQEEERQKKKEEEEKVRLEKEEEEQRLKKEEKMMKTKENLKNGYKMTKYSKDGFNPHDKVVNISMDEKYLCWKDRDSEDKPKFIPLGSIKWVTYSKIGEGIKRHQKAPKKSLYCVIDYLTTDSKEKVIELGAESADLVLQFSQELNYFTKNK